MRGKSESQDQYVARMFARHTGLSGDSLLQFMGTQDHLRRKIATEADWAVVEKFAASPHIEFRVNSEIALGFTVGTRFENRARAVLRKLAEDSEPGIKLIALYTLTSMRDPDASRFLETDLESKDPFVSTKVREFAIREKIKIDRPLR